MGVTPAGPVSRFHPCRFAMEMSSFVRFVADRCPDVRVRARIALVKTSPTGLTAVRDMFVAIMRRRVLRVAAMTIFPHCRQRELSTPEQMRLTDVTSGINDEIDSRSNHQRHFLACRTIKQLIYIREKRNVRDMFSLLCATLLRISLCVSFARIHRAEENVTVLGFINVRRATNSITDRL